LQEKVGDYVDFGVSGHVACRNMLESECFVENPVT